MQDVAVGESGEIILKGPIVSKGYYNNPKATTDSFRDGWFCTGDIGIFQKELLYIVDRKKVKIPVIFEIKYSLTINRSSLNTRDIKLRPQNLKRCSFRTI